MTDPRDTGSEAAPAEAVPQPSRVFVGLKMAPEIAAELAALSERLEGVPLRLVPAEDIHLTLVPPWLEVSIPGAVAKLGRAVTAFGRFQLRFERLCYGPQARRPRLLWVECAADPDLAQLQASVLKAFGQLNDRPFRPHVTVARLKRNTGGFAKRPRIDHRLDLTQWVRSVELFRSPPPGERGYRVLASLPLREKDIDLRQGILTLAADNVRRSARMRRQHPRCEEAAMPEIAALKTASEETEEWISALMARLGWQDRERAYLALLAALHALRDSLSRDEAGYLGTQLPVLLRGLYFEGWHPGSRLTRARSRTGFLERIEEGVHRDPGIDPEQVAHAVFALLAERLPEGELEDAKAATPSPLRMFWPD